MHEHDDTLLPSIEIHYPRSMLSESEHQTESPGAAMADPLQNRFRLVFGPDQTGSDRAHRQVGSPFLSWDDPPRGDPLGLAGGCPRARVSTVKRFNG